LDPPASLVHALGGLSEAIPTHIAYTFLVDGEQEEQNITFRELDWRAQAVAARLQRLAGEGDRAALVFEPGLDYIAALVGCFYAGVVAVPIYPPDPMRLERTASRLRAVMDDARAELVLTSSSEYARFGSFFASQGQVVLIDQVPEWEATDWTTPDIHAQTLALLQYTSGSTGRPKGVMLTHENLMFNFEHIKKFDEPDAVAVSWLPMYHDMGLIGLVLQVLQSGRRTVLMSPLSFVKRPARWLEAISNYRAYATSGPSFAYDLCVQKVSEEEMKRLDLSCWTLACNGAEPIRPDTMDRFSEKFATVGFRREAFYPCYGLAEATLIVSGGDKAAPPIVRAFDATELESNRVRPVGAPGQGRRIVGCGRTVDRQEIAIVEPTSRRRCLPNEVGEIWVRGAGVARGYWDDVAATEETFQAYTADTKEGPFLRTGDLGFLADDELFVTGRIKDMIIVRGRNHYPQDLERTVERCHRSLRPNTGAAFSIDVDGEERVVVVQGVVRPQKLDLDQVFAEIRTALLHEHELAPHAIVLVKGGEIPRTSSGKLQRRACKDLYLGGELSVVAEWRAEPVKLPPVTDRVNGSAIAVQGRFADSDDELESYTLRYEGGREAILETVATIIRELKHGKVPTTINERSLFFADLSIESIDLVMLNEMVESHYRQQFPFVDFMAELGRQNRRDVALGQFVEFLFQNMGCR
jgi:acyl-CoA synthetase (AMP-forming)/AMP-acid ligase II